MAGEDARLAPIIDAMAPDGFRGWHIVDPVPFIVPVTSACGMELVMVHRDGPYAAL